MSISPKNIFPLEVLGFSVAKTIEMVGWQNNHVLFRYDIDNLHNAVPASPNRRSVTWLEGITSVSLRVIPDCQTRGPAHKGYPRVTSKKTFLKNRGGQPAPTHPGSGTLWGGSATLKRNLLWEKSGVCMGGKKLVTGMRPFSWFDLCRRWETLPLHPSPIFTFH